MNCDDLPDELYLGTSGEEESAIAPRFVASHAPKFPVGADEMSDELSRADCEDVVAEGADIEMVDSGPSANASASTSAGVLGGGGEQRPKPNSVNVPLLVVQAASARGRRGRPPSARGRARGLGRRQAPAPNQLAISGFGLR